jgi:hypothetical protein
MPIIKISEEKVGPSMVINVDMGLNDVPVFPAVCPCCMEPTEDGAVIVALCKQLPPISFPACKVCARHSALEGRISAFVGPLLFMMTILTVAGFLIYRGVHNTAQLGLGAGAGWQVFGALLNLQFPFMSPINAGVTLLGGFAVLLVYLFIYWLIVSPIFWYLGKSSCKWFNQAARTTRWFYSGAGGYCRRFILENPEYATQFSKANGPETDLYDTRA